MEEYRIGHGYDVHRFFVGRRLILGGVTIPSEKGLLGHSDADVLLHAIIDALLGAAALGDIGGIFPDTDNSYLNASSIKLLERVREIIAENRYVVVNVDSTIVMQSPKVNPYIQEMRSNISTALGISLERVNVKATTEEGLGFTGSGEGVAAHAVVMIKK